MNDEYEDRKTFYEAGIDSIKSALEDIYRDPSVDTEYALKFIREGIKYDEISVWGMLLDIYQNHPSRTDLFRMIVKVALDFYNESGGYRFPTRDSYKKAEELWDMLVSGEYGPPVPELIYLTAKLILTTVPDGRKIIVGADYVNKNLVSVYINILEKYNIIPSKSAEQDILSVLLEADFAQTARFIIKRNIIFVMNYDVFRSLLHGMEIGDIDIRIVREFFKHVVLTQTAAKEYMRMCNDEMELAPLYHVLGYISDTGELPDYDKLLTHEELNELEESIIQGDENYVREIFDKLGDNIRTKKFIIKAGLFRRKHLLPALLRRDDVDMLKILFEDVGLDAFYEGFVLYVPNDFYRLFVTSKCFGIYNYLLESSEESDDYRKFWDHIVFYSILTKEHEVFRFIIDSYTPSSYTIESALDALIEHSLNISELNVLFYYLDELKESSDRFRSYLWRTVSRIFKRFLDLDSIENYIETAMKRYDIPCLSYDDFSILLDYRISPLSIQYLFKKLWNKRCDLEDYDIDSLLLYALIDNNINIFNHIAETTGFYNRSSYDDFITWLLTDMSYETSAYRVGFEKLLLSSDVPDRLKNEIVKTIVENEELNRLVPFIPEGYTPDDKDVYRKLQVLREKQEV